MLDAEWRDSHPEPEPGTRAHEAWGRDHADAIEGMLEILGAEVDPDAPVPPTAQQLAAVGAPQVVRAGQHQRRALAAAGASRARMAALGPPPSAGALVEAIRGGGGGPPPGTTFLGGGPGGQPPTPGPTAGFGLIDIAPTASEQAVLEEWVRSGLDLIVTIPQQQLDSLEATIADQVRRGLSVGDIQSEVIDRADKVISDRWARVIARDQVGKVNAAITQTMQRRVGVTEYIWRTSGAPNVRESHAAMNGRRVRWDTPPEGTGPYGQPAHAGEAIQCACWADPVLDD